MVSKKEIFILIILIAIGAIRFCFFRPEPPKYANALDKAVRVEGIIMSPPDIRLANTRLTVTPRGQEANILVITKSLEKFSYGDKIVATGILEAPEDFTTTSGKEFKYERYLANQDTYFVIKDADIAIISHGNLSKLKFTLYRLRDAFMQSIAAVIAPPESDLANGLVLGARGGFDSDMRDEFISTGTIHIVALSGYNVTIVAESVMKVLGLVLSQMLSIVFGMLIIVLFILMAGASSTAIRAGIMAVIALTARMTGRTYDAGRALVVAALLMIAYDPRVLTDISFQLSFLATFGVLFITPRVIRWVWFIPIKFGLRELVATTLGATISVLPILLYSTGILSLVSLPANILILPFIPLTMFFIFIVGMIGFVSTTLSIPLAFIPHLLLKYILSMIHFFASLPFASVIIASFPIWLTIILYGALLWWVWKKKD